MTIAAPAGTATAKPPASPPPPPVSPPPPPPSLSSLGLIIRPGPIDKRETQWIGAGSSSAMEEVTAPARLLYRMSIASLVGKTEAGARGHAHDQEHAIELSGSSSDDDSSSTSSSLSSDAEGSKDAAARTPVNSVTQDKVRRLWLKRPPSAGPHAYAGDDDDDFSSSEGETEWKSALQTPPPKQLKSAQRKSANTKPKPKARTKAARKMTARGTMIVYQPTCLDHHNDAHQENRARLSVLCGPEGILQRPRFRDLQWANLRELRPARLSDMLRVHSFQYIQHLEKMCASLPPQTKACSVGTFYRDESAAVNVEKTSAAKDDGRELFPNDWLETKHAQKCYAAENPPSGGHFDNDSPISRSSYLAARLAAGAVCHAIDQVLHGETRNAFVVVRPPGHHAGPNGCVDSEDFHRRPEMCTCGFCLLNNVAIGAAYAMTAYAGAHYYHGNNTHTNPQPPHIERVAIIDFDIHHGNGTEEILRNLVPHQQRYPLPSSWAPLSFPSYKPWRDERDVDNVFFASIHLHDGDSFYPCSGKGPQGDSPELETQENILNLPLDFIGPRYLDDREKLTVKAKKSLMDRASRAFRDRVTNRLIPALRKFQPDLVLLSAGFDGHADDFYYYLTEDDYEWATEQLAGVAKECCDGRLVSVLEGGYNVQLSAQQKRKLKAKNKGKKSHSGWSSTSSSPAASPARSTRTEGEEEDEDESEGRDGDDYDREEEQLVYGSLARSCAAHVEALQRAGVAK